MAHSWIHAKSSAKRFGGIPQDYIKIHDWFDATKELEPSFRHRALRHHTHGIFEAERLFGHVILNSNGREVPVRVIAEQHIKEDFGGFIPTPSDWLKSIRQELWMQPSASFTQKLNNFVEGTKEIPEWFTNGAASEANSDTSALRKETIDSALSTPKCLTAEALKNGISAMSKATTPEEETGNGEKVNQA